MILAYAEERSMKMSAALNEHACAKLVAEVMSNLVKSQPPPATPPPNCPWGERWLRPTIAAVLTGFAKDLHALSLTVMSR